MALHRISSYGEEGYTGELDVTVEFTFTDLNELIIEYLATTNKKTIVNLTHHAFFCLAGAADPTPTIEDQICEINADFQCNPLQGPDCLNIIKKLQAGEKVDQKTFMAEPWYVAEDKLTEITYTNNSGKEVTEPLVHVDQAVVDAAY